MSSFPSASSPTASADLLSDTSDVRGPARMAVLSALSMEGFTFAYKPLALSYGPAWGIKGNLIVLFYRPWNAAGDVRRLLALIGCHFGVADAAALLGG